jgi:L-alanine-DL-glutamate epimerase-like enolase superfamily enzyme
MKIESVDFFYLSMPEVLDIGDGSQDALLVRIRAGGHEGWGECEASPLTSIASYVCPTSHSACKPLKSSVEGRPVNDIKDIRKISQLVHEQSLDLLQADHTLSGIDIALYDLLGRLKNVPVFDLLGYKKVYPKIPYASQLFADTPEETFEKAKRTRADGFRAVKFGWGPFGKNISNDVDHLNAAREGAGPEMLLMIDAGTVWGDDVQEAASRLKALEEVNAYWLEEPFFNLSLQAYQSLSNVSQKVPLAGGEGCSNEAQARAMIDHGGIGFIQIDAGRVGGITAAHRLVKYASEKNVQYVNHTFTSNLALSASLQPYAGVDNFKISEYPVELKQLAKDIGNEKIERDAEGYIHVPQGAGLGVSVNIENLRKYIVDVEIKVQGKVIYQTPAN